MDKYSWFIITMLKENKAHGGVFSITIIVFRNGITDLSSNCLGYDTELSDSKALNLELWGMWSTRSLPLLSGPLRVLSFC